MENEKTTFKLLADLLSYIVSLPPIIISFYCTYLFLTLNLPLIIRLILSPIFLPLIFIFIIFLIRKLFIPKLKHGVYPLGLNKGFTSWYLTLALGRSIRICHLQEYIYSFFIFKYLYWKAMGAKIAFGVNSSMHVDLVDLPLITIGKNSSITDKVQISGHVFVKNKLFLSEVKIGKNCFIGMHSIIGARTQIGDNCYIGIGNKLFNKKIKDNTRIENFEMEKGD